MDDVRNPDPIAPTTMRVTHCIQLKPLPDEPARHRWQDENRDAVAVWDVWTSSHGLLVADLRLH